MAGGLPAPRARGAHVLRGASSTPARRWSRRRAAPGCDVERFRIDLASRTSRPSSADSAARDGLGAGAAGRAVAATIVLLDAAVRGARRLSALGSDTRAARSGRGRPGREPSGAPAARRGGGPEPLRADGRRARSRPSATSRRRAPRPSCGGWRARAAGQADPGAHGEAVGAGLKPLRQCPSRESANRGSSTTPARSVTCADHGRARVPLRQQRHRVARHRRRAPRSRTRSPC